jgi:hypothetical protein
LIERYVGGVLYGQIFPTNKHFLTLSTTLVDAPPLVKRYSQEKNNFINKVKDLAQKTKVQKNKNS